MEPRTLTPPEAPGQETPEEAAPQSGGVGRAVLKGLGILLLVVVGLVVLLLLALQTRPGAERALAVILRTVNPYEDATLSVGEVKGNWLSNLSLYDVRLMRENGTPMALIDTLELRYNLLALPGKRLHIRSGYLSGAYLNIEQGPDKVFDISIPFLPDTLALVDTTQGLRIQVDDLKVRRTQAAIEFYNPERDSTLRITGLRGDLNSLLLTESVAFNLDSLRFAYTLPTDLGEGTFRTGASLINNVLTVQDLRLLSDHSRVLADGRLRLPESDDADVSDIRFKLTAQPLSFRDIAPFVAVDPDRSLTLDAEITGSQRLLEIDLDGTLSDGATVALAGTFTPAIDDRVAYDFTGQVRNLDPGFFGPPDSPPAGRVNLDLRADLEGPALDQISGTAHATLTDSRFGEFALDRTVLDARFYSGRGQIELATGLRGAAFRLGGQVWPFEDEPRYDLNGRFRNVDIARFSEGGAQSSNLDGTLRVQGRGISPETARVEARANLNPSRINDYALTDGLISAELANGDLDLSARVLLPEGLIAVRGGATFGETLTYRVTQGRVENLDVAALTGDTTYSRINSTFTLRGAGTDPNTLRLTANVNLDETVYGPYVVQDGDLDATINNGRLTSRVRAALRGGDVSFVATALPFRQVPTFEVREGRFQNVDLGVLTQNPDLSTNLDGTLRLEGRGFDPQTMVLEGRVDLDASRVNAQDINSAFVTAALERGALAYRLGLDVPGGETRLEGTARPFDAQPTYRVDEGVFAGIDVGAFTGDDALTTNLNGTLALAGEGFDPQTMALTLDLGLLRSRVNNGHIEAGDLDVRLADGLARLDADFDLLTGRARLDASGRFFDEVPTYTATGLFRNVNAAAFAGNDTLDALASLAFTVDGTGFDPETMTLAAALTADSSRFEGVVLDTATVRLNLAEGVLRVDTLGIASNVFMATANGQIALFDTLRAPSDFRLEATFTDLVPLRPFLNAEMLAAETGHVEARVFGRPGQLTFETKTELRSLVYNNLRLAGLDLYAVGELNSARELTVGEVNGSLSYFSVPGINLRNTELTARYENEELGFDVTLDADDRRDVRLRGRVDLRPEANTLTIDSLRFRFDQDRWNLLQPATVAYGEQYKVDGFLLTTGDQQIAIDGTIDPRGTQSLIFTIEGFRVGAVADLLGFEGLDGTLNGAIDLTGPAFAPNLIGALELDVISYEKGVGDLQLDLRYDSLRLNTTALFTHTDNSTLTIDGYIPLDLRLAPTNPEGATVATEGVRLEAAEAPVQGEVAFTIVADSFSIGWVRPFLDEEVISELSGKLDADMVFGGTFERPSLEGDAALVGGRLGLTELSQTYTNIGVQVVLADNEARIERLSATSGGGTLTGTGTIALANLALGELDIDYQLQDFRAISNAQYRFALSGQGRVQGTTEAPIVRGDIRVISGDIILVDAVQFQDVPLTQEDIITVESRFGIRVTEADTTINQVYNAMTLNLAVQLERDTWLRSRSNPQMDIQFDGRLDVRKQPDGEINLFGDIQVIPERSRVIQFGRRFDIASGEIQFNGPLTEMLLDINARYQVRQPRTRETGPTITLGISGRLDDLDLTLGSEPTMETADIVSYIATGRPASQSLQFSADGQGEGGGIIGQGAGLALGQLASAIEGVAARDLGLDVIEIEQDGLRGTRLTAGRYFSRRLYASISQPISYGAQASTSRNTQERPTVVTLEYEVSSALLARLIRDGSAVRVNLQWEYAY